MNHLSRAGSILGDICYKNSIFFALNNDALAKERERYKDLTSKQVLILGLKEGAKRLIPSILLIAGLQLAVRNAKTGNLPTQSFPTLFQAVKCAVVEEMIFRGFLQNGMAFLQKTITYIAPECLQKKRTFQWLMSPSARILCVNSLFAYSHLYNDGGYVSTKGAFIQATNIMLSPAYSILYETTCNIGVPLYAHVANNVSVIALLNLLQLALRK